MDGFQKRIKELSDISQNRDIAACSRFLTLDEQSQFYAMRTELAGSRYVLTGGFPHAERKLVCFLPFYEDEETWKPPIRWLSVSPVNERFSEELTHRDYLGAVMSLGIERDRIGDIVIQGKTAYIAVLEEMAEYLIREMSTVRRTTVVCAACDLPDSLASPKLRDVTGSVASARLDTLVSLAFHISRGTAAEAIKAGYVFTDGKVCLSPGTAVAEGTVVSVRHRGKFLFLEKGGTSRKGRQFVHLGVYM